MTAQIVSMVYYEGKIIIACANGKIYQLVQDTLTRQYQVQLIVELKS